ncbi:hypothetical protein [Plasmodium yoelii yoelii]|uniref:Uncharacterized protein n=1 Tax=Plasmodium yoelii yoelii TaxID=73239 RepID=Q7RGA5_PLAYO|nr:hypothetical protein [Plasmodium yoelii yoelii]
MTLFLLLQSSFLHNFIYTDFLFHYNNYINPFKNSFFTFIIINFKKLKMINEEIRLLREKEEKKKLRN